MAKKAKAKGQVMATKDDIDARLAEIEVDIEDIEEMGASQGYVSMKATDAAYLIARLREAREKEAKYQSSLQDWGEHEPNCKYWDEDLCDCGLMDAQRGNFF